MKSPTVAVVIVVLQAGIEIYDQTNAQDLAVAATGTQNTPAVGCNLFDSVLVRNPRNTMVDPNTSVSVYSGEWGANGQLLGTVQADARGQWEWDGWVSGIPIEVSGLRIFTQTTVQGNSIYSDGIRLSVNLPLAV